MPGAGFVRWQPLTVSSASATGLGQIRFEFKDALSNGASGRPASWMRLCHINIDLPMALIVSKVLKCATPKPVSSLTRTSVVSSQWEITHERHVSLNRSPSLVSARLFHSCGSFDAYLLNSSSATQPLTFSFVPAAELC